MTVDGMDQFLLAAAAVVLFAIVAVRLTARAPVPTLLVFLGIGLLMGQTHLVAFTDAASAHALGFAALVVILTEGGLTTRWSHVRPALPPAVALATVGVGVTTALIALGLHLIADLPLREAALYGAIFASTDAAAVFSILRAVPVRRRLVGILEAESGLNDAPTVILVTLLSTAVPGELAGWQVFGLVVYELAIGVVVGFAVAQVLVALLRRVALPASGLYPLAVLSGAVLAYGAASSALHASGFAAVYAAALVLGNSDLPHRVATRSFAEGLAWIAQIGLFVMLGLLADLHDLDRSVIGTAVLVTVVALIARPIAVAAATSWFRIPWAEQAFLTFAGLRGAVPIVLATIPLAAAADTGGRVFDVVFVSVFVLTALQTPPLPWLARRLGVLMDDASRELDVESSPLDRVAAELLQTQVAPESRLHGVEVGELRLPEGASLALIVRDGRTFAPDATLRLRHGDQLLVVTPRVHRDATEARLRNLSRHGRLAGWRRGLPH